MGVLFKLDHVFYSYNGEEPALDDINLTVNEGEKLVLLGANGSGKSTLLKILDGLMFPQKGNYWAFDQLITEKSLEKEDFSCAFRKKVGFIFQNPETQLFSSSVWDEIAFGPLQLNLGQEEVAQRVEEIIAALKLEKLKDRPPYHLSGGEKKKVAIASVLSINPSVLLLDEPTSALEPRTQRWLINLLLELNLQAGKTLITATHNLDIVEEIADRVVVFGEDHRIVKVGPPAQILADTGLLLSVNLVDDHFHRHAHDQSGHVHYHTH